MVAEAQRLEDAARTAMGDYSEFGIQIPGRTALLQSLIDRGRFISGVILKALSKPSA